MAELTVTDARARLADVVDAARVGHDPVYLTRRGQRIAAVIDADDLDRLIAAAEDLGGTLKAFNAMAKVREPELLAPHLPEIQVPVLLLIGTARHQGTVKPDEIDRMRTLLPAFSMDTVSGVGHYIQEERPQAVFDALQRLHLLVGRAPALETTLR